MKTKQFLMAVFSLFVLWAVQPARAIDITANGSGNWSSTVPDAPWPNGTVPSTNDSVDIESPFTVTVDSTAICAYIYGSGTVVMAPNSKLDVMGDTVGAYGTQSLGYLDATASGNTINYHGNAFWAKRCDYYNLILSGSGDFYNGTIPAYGPTSMTIGGDMKIIGTSIAIQQGADITINGSLYIQGVSNKWDCSVANLTVASNLFLTGTRDLLVDLDGADGVNNFMGNVTVAAGVLAWNISDVVTWGIGGSLTNLGLITGKGYGSIFFYGAGIITGNPLKLPTVSINGTYLIDTSITLTTNTPGLLGTMIFDIAKTNTITLQSYPTNQMTFYYGGGLNLINSGAAPTPGKSYKFFNATSFDGAFSPLTFPTVPVGGSWVDNTLLSGSVLYNQSGGGGSPSLQASNTGSVLSLTWDSSTYPGYSIEAQTNSQGISTNWFRTGTGTVSPVTIGIATNPAVFFRLVKP